MSIFLIAIYCVCCAYMILNFKHDIHMFQQNSYRLKRYWKFLKGGDLSSPWRLVDSALFFLLFSTLMPSPYVSALIIAVVLLIKIYLIAREKFKKPLVFTKRVWRIYSVTAILAVGAFLAVILTTWKKDDLSYHPVEYCLGALLVISIFSWLFVMVADIILMPVEKIINRRYWKEADSILKSMRDLKIIGITGSYGKTSTKHYLERILSEDFNVLMTPGSYNTPMGVIRTVREMMKPYHTVFICEMGAKQKGDIKEICDLVHPQYGIITAVGPMHLETFKTIDNVQATKFELADALPSNGLAVINDDFDYCANRPVNNADVARYRLSEDNNDNIHFRAIDINYSKSGTSFTLVSPEGKKIMLHTRLVGACNVSNLIAAIIVALRLGISEEKIKRAVEDIKQVEHRLSMKQTAGGVTIIDDAFNSNPEGSRMALEVLSNFKEGRRIVVTPGMIELGSHQYELNKQLGATTAKNADIIFIVGHHNRDSLKEGILSENFNTNDLYIVDSFNEAQQKLENILKAGDTILYENDLPDSFK